ncbi:histidine kinase [Nocardioides sp. CER19]|uniref:sensor histidine kinase n=1 Tax=Nocardioides sp. CER19 TaxID=3038538 RepID=UPI002448FF6E|nr:histidine kinase [Nocardioides sp. CER19]MDH2415965.1 histidine kinase [Nocardioides sp. CER19]
MRWRVAGGCWLTAAAVLVAVPFAAVDDAELEAPDLGDPSWWAGLAVVTLQAAVLLGRRVSPVALLVVAAGAPLAALVGLQGATGATSVAVLVAAFLVVLSEPTEGAWPGLVGATALVALGTALGETDSGTPTGAAVGGGLVQGIGTVALAVVVGIVVRARREARTARADQARALVGEHAALLEAAVAKERTAMARELHDIAAHHLSGIAVMTGAIGRQIDTDPEGAKRAVREVRTHSTEMLRDMRRLVGLLREDGAESQATMAREESLSGISGLVDAAGRTGTEVTLTVHPHSDGGPPGSRIGPLAQLSAYRTVQEALANAARHAPGARCEVVVDAREADAVVVSVRNDASDRQPVHPEPSGGFGLVGMRERAELTGAALDVGPAPDGGWLVSLRIPTLDTVTTGEDAR